MDRLDNSRCQQIQRTRIRMRVEALHVDNTLILRRHDFRQMRMDQRRLARMHVHVEQGRVRRRQE